MFGNDWDIYLKDEINKDYFINLLNKVDEISHNNIVYPSKELIFNAFLHTSFKDVKVVILGQDPYHGEGQAEGLSFSVPNGIKLPPSLKNIFKELNSDLNLDIPESGSLKKWSDNGIFLLNSILTVIKDKPLSMKNIGWEEFTDKVISIINDKDTPVVFILWGTFARSKKNLITNKKHLVIESVHPSPLSAYNGFFGSKPFSKTNEFFLQNNLSKVDFSLK